MIPVPLATKPFRDPMIFSHLEHESFQTAKGSVSSRVAGVFLGLIGAVVIVAALGFVFWKYRQRRYECCDTD